MDINSGSDVLESEFHNHAEPLNENENEKDLDCDVNNTHFYKMDKPNYDGGNNEPEPYGQLQDFLPRDEAVNVNDVEFDPNSINDETTDILTVNNSIQKHVQTLKNIQLKVASSNEVFELKSTVDVLLKVIEDLQAKLNSYIIDIGYFKDDDKKTLYYTGLPKFVLLQTFINKLSPYVERTEHNSLNIPQMLILTLMKLRLGLQFKDLGYRFRISTQTASRTFYSCLNVMYSKMKSMVYRPHRDEVIRTMPKSFRENFGDRIFHIIDCLEMFIERPYYFDTRVQCWSEYKHHYTLKYLISITPQGMFEFISRGYGGRANDMFITTNSNFFDILQPNDSVLADKGFNMHDVFELRRVNLEIPAFVYKQQQLHPIDIENTRKVANVRIHVERCIGLLKRKFLILHRIIPVTMLSKPLSDSDGVPVMDKIITVCCALCNLCPPIIPNYTE